MSIKPLNELVNPKAFVSLSLKGVELLCVTVRLNGCNNWREVIHILLDAQNVDYMSIDEAIETACETGKSNSYVDRQELLTIELHD